MNPVQFNSSRPTRPSLSNQDFYIGTAGDYGPSTDTGFYAGLGISSGEYNVYVGSTPLNTTVRKFPSKASVTTYLKGFGWEVKDDRQFPMALQTASFSNGICVINKDLEGIYADKVNFHFDAGFTPCFASGSEKMYVLNNNFSGDLLPTGTSTERYSEDNGGYISFRSNGSQYIETNYTLPVSFRSPFTLNFWVYLSGSQASSTRLFSKAPSSGTNGFEVGINGNKIFVTVASNTSNWNLVGDPALTVDDWNFISLRCNSTSDELSINNSQYSTKLRSLVNITSITSTRAVYLGSLGGTTNYFNGGIGVATMYTERLKDNSTSQNFNAYKGRFGL